MSEDTLLPFDLPSVARKKLSVGFDGGQLSSDAGVLVLRGVEKKLGLAARLAACIRDRRKPERIEHQLEEMLRLRMFAIAAGYEDADDCDRPPAGSAGGWVLRKLPARAILDHARHRRYL